MTVSNSINIITSQPFCFADGTPVDGQLQIIPSSKFLRPGAGQTVGTPVTRDIYQGVLVQALAVPVPAASSPTFGITFVITAYGIGTPQIWENVAVVPDANGNFDLATLNTGQYVKATPQVLVSTGALTVNPDTVTLPAGSSAAVVNQGTTAQPVLQFSLPQGLQGIQGVKGDPGAPAVLPANLSLVATDGSGAAVQATGIPATAVAGLAGVATSGAYADLTGKPTIPTVPDLAPVATSGAYADLTGKPVIPTVPALAEVATTGSYADLLNRPAIPSVPTAVSAFANDVGYALLSALSRVASSGSYADLQNKPTIPTVPTALSAFANDVGYALLSTLSKVATSGAYSDLTGSPSITGTGTNGLTVIGTLVYQNGQLYLSIPS